MEMKGAIFDMDGLLFDTENIYQETWNELAAERIGYTPETCYVFEDSENGIRAGKAAGCTAIMIPDVLAPSEEIKKLVDGIYESLDEFTEEEYIRWGIDSHH